MRRPRAEVRSARDLVVLGRVAAWAVLLPVLVRAMDLPALLSVLTPSSGRIQPTDALDVDRVVRLADLALGRAPGAHRTCLVRSLVLYRLLRTAGEPVQIHLGVRHKGDRVAAHSWLTREGQSVGESSGQNGFTEIYVYPAGSGAAPGLPGKEQVPCV